MGLWGVVNVYRLFLAHLGMRLDCHFNVATMCTVVLHVFGTMI